MFVRKLCGDAAALGAAEPEPRQDGAVLAALRQADVFIARLLGVAVFRHGLLAELHKAEALAGKTCGRGSGRRVREKTAHIPVGVPRF